VHFNVVEIVAGSLVRSAEVAFEADMVSESEKDTRPSVRSMG
jgi:hypothetical protein